MFLLPVARTSARWFACVALAAAFLGCSATADLPVITSEKPGTVLRSDQLQSAATNGSTTVAVGTGGVVIASGDGGKSWTRAVLSGRSSLIGVSACPDGSFVALDFYRRIWIGDPSAKSWRARDLPSEATPLALTCDFRGRYWVVGSLSTVLSSGDQGATWKEVSLNEDLMLTTVQFVDDDFGVATGEFGTLLITRDGGSTWQQGKKIPNEFYPYAALFVDRHTGWVTGLAGVILHTSDGGESWVRQPSALDVPMYGLVQHAGKIHAVGNNGQMLRLQDGRWESLEHGKPAPSYLRTAVSLNPRQLLIAGGAGTLHVVDTATDAVASSAGK